MGGEVYRTTGRGGRIAKAFSTARSSAGAGSFYLTIMEYLTIKQVAAALQLTYERVRQLVHEGEIPSRRIGKTIRIPASFINNQQQS